MGRILTPSIFLFGKDAFVIAAMVGNKSMVEANWLLTILGCIVPFHLIIPGTRCPPSNEVPLPSRNPPVDPA